MFLDKLIKVYPIFLYILNKIVYNYKILVYNYKNIWYNYNIINNFWRYLIMYDILEQIEQYSINNIICCITPYNKVYKVKK